jgi:hypothetical protein
MVINYIVMLHHCTVSFLANASLYYLNNRKCNSRGRGRPLRYAAERLELALTKVGGKRMVGFILGRMHMALASHEHATGDTIESMHACGPLLSLHGPSCYIHHWPATKHCTPHSRKQCNLAR